jgi:hypothetical protein
MRRSLLVIGLAALAATQSLTAQTPAAPAQTPATCDAIGDVQFICGQNGPEDLVVVPGSQWVVASAFGAVAVCY